jgi:hypothetical protein
MGRGKLWLEAGWLAAAAVCCSASGQGLVHVRALCYALT